MEVYSEAEKEELLKAAQAYNKEMAGEGDADSSDTLKNTTSYADFLKTGTIIGYLQIDKINVNLPIYQGSTDTILERGVGHLENSSMPVGGRSTHSVLTGHRGLPTSTLFTHLDKVEIGDMFKITAFDTTITYKVDQILTVTPEDVSALQIEEGKDYCTLITCTPYMINTHRLLVRGTRIENIDEENGVFDSESEKYYPNSNTWDGVFPLGFTIIIIASSLIFISSLKDRHDLSNKRKRKRKQKDLKPITTNKDPVIPINDQERVKVYDLPMLKVKEKCDEIIIDENEGDE